MSDTTTPFLGLTKPAIGGSRDTWGNKGNADNDIIDTNAQSVKTELDALQATVQAIQAQLAAAGPGEAIGTVKWWPSNRGFPATYEICDGHWLAPAQFPTLFGILGTQWGGDGVNSFGLPDLRGLVPVGMDEGTGRLQGQYGPDVVGGIGGAAVVGLTVAQMPYHAHTGVTDAQGSHNHQAPFPGPNPVGGGPYTTYSAGPSFQGFTTDVQGNHAHNLAIDPAGSSAGHSNVQPGALGYYIIKVVTA
jgi:microcystin-dependent protein